MKSVYFDNIPGLGSTSKKSLGGKLHLTDFFLAIKINTLALSMKGLSVPVEGEGVSELNGMFHNSFL